MLLAPVVVVVWPPVAAGVPEELHALTMTAATAVPPASMVQVSCLFLGLLFVVFTRLIVRMSGNENRSGW